ncbi:MAG: tetratricopeptide repeat protein [Phycisphaerales bacterium JB041]
MTNFRARYPLAGAAVCALVFLWAGCASSGRSPYTPAADAPRNPLEAQRLTQQAAALLESHPERAERLLREALAADLFHGPAHNNLGVIHLSRNEMYLAAEEFEWARRLMPGHPDPRLNLAVTLERVGRFDDAIDEYRSALQTHPGHIQTIQALTRCRLRHAGDLAADDAELCAHLEDIALRGDSPEWRAWARRQLLRL